MRWISESISDIFWVRVDGIPFLLWVNFWMKSGFLGINFLISNSLFALCFYMPRFSSFYSISTTCLLIYLIKLPPPFISVDSFIKKSSSWFRLSISIESSLDTSSSLYVLFIYCISSFSYTFKAFFKTVIWSDKFPPKTHFGCWFTSYWRFLMKNS